MRMAGPLCEIVVLSFADYAVAPIEPSDVPSGVKLIKML